MARKKKRVDKEPVPRKLADDDLKEHWRHWLSRDEDQRLIVAVLRDDLGIVFSQVAAFPFRRGTVSLSYDRQTRGRSPLNDEGVIINRAKLLAHALGLEYLEDLRWPCRANTGLKCYCPECNLPPNVETRPRGSEW